MYTSGCPKNQNRCWNNTGLPPLLESKNLVLNPRSIINIVIAPASTGRANNSKKEVAQIDNVSTLTLSHENEGAREHTIVVKKFIAPKREDKPAKCKEKYTKNTDTLVWYWVERGG